jgi:hypothetical protein
MYLLKYFLILLLLFGSVTFSQSDSTKSNVERFQFTPRVAGGQIEATTFLYVTEFGALIDFDIISKIENDTKSFGLRFGVEYYSYLEAGGPTGGGPFTDYCIYGRHTIRMNDFWFTILGGFAYHTYDATYYDDKVLFRAGLEFKYNLLGNEAGLLLKGSTSFREQTTYFGLGIFIGYFE